MSATEIDLTGVLINCPDKRFELRKATSCFSCMHYNGIVRAEERGKPIPGNDPNFIQVLCSRPITRKLIKVVDE